jgi:predicted ArsR family transcriptional regulator
MTNATSSQPLSTLQQQARALGDPTRHRIFRYLADAGSPVGVAELTEHMGLNHNAIRQHLAKLITAGLVAERTTAGGSRGRPRLIYEIDPSAESRWGVTGPYERLSHLLAEIIRTGDTPVEVGRRSVHQQPADPSSPGDAIAALALAMTREGFDPEVRRRGNRVDILLHACPFESTAVADPDIVCNLHLGIAQGLAAHNDRVVLDELVRKDPRRASCRLRLHVEPPA